MTYNPNIPLSTDLISNSQAQLLTNFAQLNTQFSIDHTAYNTGSGNGNGFHKQVTLVTNAAPGAQVNPQSVLYSKTISGVVAPYFRNAVGESVIWRGGSGNGLTNFTSSNLTLPNGMQMSYGQGTTNGSGDATVTFSFPTNLYSATLTRIISGGNNRGFVQWGSTPTKTSGAVRLLDSGGSGVAGIFYWIAIGN